MKLTGSSPRDGRSMKGSAELLYFAIGAGLGAGIALLFAPKSGSELRDDISEISRKGYSETLDAAKHIKDTSDNFYQSVKEKAGKAFDLAADQLSVVHSNVDKTVELAGELVDGKGEKAAKVAPKTSGSAHQASNTL